ncbi:TolC family protein [Cupriavidus necator]|uniref:TolC family protein n=1 Tax=Cupriavidus necator TaxID=106590 RepID=UPI001F33EC34|nr:TolC family protein [Cupriavidus necator]
MFLIPVQRKAGVAVLLPLLPLLLLGMQAASGVELSGDTDPIPLVPAAKKVLPADATSGSGWDRLPARPAAGASAPAASSTALSNEERLKGVTGPGFSLWELSEELRANNPQLIQARALYQAAKATVPQIAAPNNPQVGLIWGNLPKNSPLALARAESFSYTLTQSFPFPGKKALAADIANTQAESLDAQRDALFLQLYAQLSTTYFQALSQKAQLDVLRLNLKRLEQVKQVARIRYANNAAGYVDYLNAQVAQSSAQNDVFGLERQYDNALKAINTLIGKNPEFPLELRPDASAVRMPPVLLPELEDMALREHPNVRASRFQVEAAEKGVRLARKAYLPDFQIIGTFNGSNPPLGFKPASYGIEFDVIIPLFFFTKERYGVDEAVANKVASDANDQSVRQQTLLAVDTAHNNLNQAVKQAEFLRGRQVPEAMAAYKMAFTNYANNSANFADLLAASSALKTTELAVTQAESQARQAYYTLAAAVGRDKL